MRKVLSLLIVALIVVQMTLLCAAGDDSVTYGASYTATMATPTIDGIFTSIEGWGDPLVVINADTMNSVVAKATSSGSATILSNQSEIILYMKWDKDNLYFATVRKGHSHARHYSNGWGPGGIPAWMFCATMLHIISDWSKIITYNPAYGAQPIDTIVASATTNYTDVALASYVSAYSAANKRLNLADGYQVAIKNINDVETCEIAIPWNKLSEGNRINPNEGSSFYLGVNIHNSNSTVARVYGKTAAGNGETFTSPDYYLKVNLSEESRSNPVFTDYGFSIRVADPQGLRAKHKISNEVLEATLEEDGYHVKEYGSILTQREAYDAAMGQTDAILTLNNDFSEKAATAKLMIWKDGKYYGNIYQDAGDGLIYTAVLVDILDRNLAKDYVFRAYCIIEDAAGNESVVYGDVIEASIYRIAKEVLNDSDNGLDQEALNYIQTRIIDVVEGS